MALAKKGVTQAYHEVANDLSLSLSLYISPCILSALRNKYFRPVIVYLYIYIYIYVYLSLYIYIHIMVRVCFSPGREEPNEYVIQQVEGHTA